MNDQTSKLLLQRFEVALRVLRSLNELVDYGTNEGFLEELAHQLDRLLADKDLELIRGDVIEHGHLFNLAAEGLCDDLGAEADTN